MEEKNLRLFLWDSKLFSPNHGGAIQDHSTLWPNKSSSGSGSLLTPSTGPQHLCSHGSLLHSHLSQSLRSRCTALRGQRPSATDLIPFLPLCLKCLGASSDLKEEAPLLLRANPPRTRVPPDFVLTLRLSSGLLLASSPGPANVLECLLH